MAIQSRPMALPVDFVSMAKKQSENPVVRRSSPPALVVFVGIILGTTGMVTILNSIYQAAI